MMASSSWGQSCMLRVRDAARRAVRLFRISLFEKFLLQKILQRIVVAQPCRQRHGASQATRLPLKIAAFGLPDDLDHASYDRGIDIAAEAGINLDQLTH